MAYVTNVMEKLLITLAIYALLDIDQTVADDLSRCPVHLPKDTLLKAHGGKCYQFVRTEMEWSDARHTCRARGGDLIIINRLDIQVMVEIWLKNIKWNRNGMWLGATDREDEQNWKWVNGQNVRNSYQYWDTNQPSCFLPDFWCHEDCACLRLDENYRWHDYLCSSSLYEYGFACEYNMLPPTSKPPQPLTQKATTPKTTTTTTTRAPTSSSSQAPSSTTETEIVVSIVKSDQHRNPPEGGALEDTQAENDTDLLGAEIVHNPVNIQVESQRMSSEETGMATGSVVGLVVSFVLIFIAGIVVGIFVCRRRRKQYLEDVGMGFNNVLYTAAPATRVKDTNILVAAATTHSDDDDPDDPRYTDINEVSPCAVKCVELPTYQELETSCSKQSANKQEEHHYDSIPQDDGEECGAESVGRAYDVDGCHDDASPPPPPCRGAPVSQFAPEFLQKDTDFSKAYSNNLYEYHK